MRISQSQLESLYAAVEGTSPDLPQKPSVWAARRHQRREIARIAFDCLEEGYKSRRGLRREVLKRYKSRVGFSPWQIISVVNLIIQVVKLVVQWRNSRTHSRSIEAGS